MPSLSGQGTAPIISFTQAVGEKLPREPDPGMGLVRSVAWPGRLGLVLVAALLVGALTGLTGCASQSKGRTHILVFAASSLAEALTEIGRDFEAKAGVGVIFSFGGSQTLAAQIASGAPADIFVAAGEFPVRFLQDRGLAEPDVVKLLSNKLVVVARRDGVQIRSLEELSTGAVERIAVASPDLAPAGLYARESLSRLGLWDALQPKLVRGNDVRATLAYVETGNADVALVYQTDAMTARNVTVLDIVPPDSYPPIVYPAALLPASEAKAQAAKFLDFLRGESARAVFRKHGFQPLAP